MIEDDCWFLVNFLESADDAASKPAFLSVESSSEHALNISGVANKILRYFFIVETLWLPVEQGAVFQVEFCLS